jgi:hypothetical protein
MKVLPFTEVENPIRSLDMNYELSQEGTFQSASRSINISYSHIEMISIIRQQPVH